MNSTYEKWIKELDAEERAHKEFRQRSKKIVDRYRDETKREDSRFNILWSNTETLHSAVYSKTPKPDVRRRFLDKDPISREVSEVLERALSYGLDVYDFDGTVDIAIDDYLVAGLGVARVRYLPFFEQGEPPKIPVAQSEDGKFFNGEEEVTDVLYGDEGHYVEGEPEDELVYQELTCEPVPWARFRWQPADRWENSHWSAIDHFLTKEEIEEQFGDKAAFIPMGYTSEGEKTEDNDGKSRALIHEIFDKKERKVYLICKGYPEPLEEMDDPLELQDFYPFPKPLFSTTTSDKLIPVPDFVQYQDQALELDQITQRIAKLTDELKYRGVYDAALKDDLINLANLDDGEFVPMDSFAERFGDKGLESAIKSMPLEELIKVVKELYLAREQVKQTIYEITGISDLVRGQSDPRETLGAQRIKGNFASMRIDKKKGRVAAFIRDLLRIKAEIIAEHFTPETLSLMTGIEVTPQMMEILQSDLLRAYKIDIETDSTVAADASEEQQNRVELLTAITQFMQQAGPAVQTGYLPVEVAKEMLLFGVRSFKGGRQLEDALEMIGGMNAGGLPAGPVSPEMGGMPPPMPVPQ